MPAFHKQFSKKLKDGKTAADKKKYMKVLDSPAGSNNFREEYSARKSKVKTINKVVTTTAPMYIKIKKIGRNSRE
jgi:hypothetical protein